MIDLAADVDPLAQVDPSATVWALAQVRAGALIGAESIIGRGAYVGLGVEIGAQVKVQNYALIYEPATIEDGVFIGPGVILTNDLNPRAVRPDGVLKEASDWNPVGVVVRRGASIGAGTICVAPVSIGAWALVGAGSVVTRDVAEYALVTGCPARHVGWVGEAGRRLLQDETTNLWHCPSTEWVYEEAYGILQPIREYK